MAAAKSYISRKPAAEEQFLLLLTDHILVSGYLGGFLSSICCYFDSSSAATRKIVGRSGYESMTEKMRGGLFNILSWFHAWEGKKAHEQKGRQSRFVLDEEEEWRRGPWE